MNKKQLTCFGCGKHPEQISEYADIAVVIGHTAEEVVREEEGTYDSETNYFTCTECYIMWGMPLMHELKHAYVERGY